jgi:hypothetical protein
MRAVIYKFNDEKNYVIKNEKNNKVDLIEIQETKPKKVYKKKITKENMQILKDLINK